MFSVLQRCKVGIFFKFPEKVPKIMESAVQADVHYRKVCGLQKNDRLLDTVLIDIRNRRFSKGFFEKAAEILLVHNGLSFKLTYLQFILVVGPYIIKRIFDDF